MLYVNVYNDVLGVQKSCKRNFLNLYTNSPNCLDLHGPEKCKVGASKDSDKCIKSKKKIRESTNYLNSQLKIRLA